MIITVFGATGMVGKELVKLGLYGEHTIRAYGRNVHQLIDEHERNKNLILIKGGLFDKSDVEKAIKDTDIVLSALGGALESTDNTRSLGMKYIVEAMQKMKVQRIIAIGGIGCLQADEDTLIYETESFPEQYKQVTEEHLAALSYLQKSNLSWTFVCPPVIQQGEPTGIYNTCANYPADGNTILTGDLAQFMLNEATQSRYLTTRVGIGN